MYKRNRVVYHIAVIALLMLTACQSDVADEQGGVESPLPEGYAQVRLRVSPASGGAGSKARTRAGWRDSKAKDAEMMNLWTVVVVNDETDAVYQILSCKPTGTYSSGTDDDREIDVNPVIALPYGTYRFYSFANIGASYLQTLLGITNVPSPSQNDRVETSTVGVTLPNKSEPVADLGHIYKPGSNDNTQGVTTDVDRTVSVSGNAFNVDAEDNGLGSTGIPMSNVQTATITSNTTLDLIVIRMMAKIEVQVYNDGESDVTINSISLTGVTANADDNLKLLPSLTSGANTMDYKHGDIRPNLGDGAGKGSVVYSPTSGNVVAKEGHRSSDSDLTPVTFAFYVNESTAPDNASGLFYLSLGIKTGSGEEVVYTHALINQKGQTEADNDKWDYIARNDYRIIPVVLTDWQFRIEPIAFAPIAGYPAAMLSSDALSATFSTGGMIALQPFVKKRSESTWRDFDDSEVERVSISWKNSDGDESPYGSDKIVKTPFAYDPATKYIIGELNQDKVTVAHTNKTAITVTVKLGPSGSQYTYSFTCDVNI